ncbi:hypothetical protein DIPPA_10532 [Diplonema papillatum]|nr:hypothetical protein DIPPA_10532 [Diplonema papillatum]
MCIGDAVTMREGAPAEVLRKVDALWGDACGAEVTSPTATAGAARPRRQPDGRGPRVLGRAHAAGTRRPTPETGHPKKARPARELKNLHSEKL